MTRRIGKDRIIIFREIETLEQSINKTIDRRLNNEYFKKKYEQIKKRFSNLNRSEERSCLDNSTAISGSNISMGKERRFISKSPKKKVRCRKETMSIQDNSKEKERLEFECKFGYLTVR